MIYKHKSANKSKRTQNTKSLNIENTCYNQEKYLKTGNIKTSKDKQNNLHEYYTRCRKTEDGFTI